MYTEILDEFVKLAEENPEEAEKIASELLKEAGISTALKDAAKKGTKKITAVGSGIKDVVSAVGSDIRNTGLKKNIEGALDGDVLKANVGKTMHNVGNVLEKHPVGSMTVGATGGLVAGNAMKKKNEKKEASYIDAYNDFVKLAESIDGEELEKISEEILNKMIEKEAANGVSSALETYRKPMSKEYNLNKKEIPEEDLAAYKQFYDSRNINNFQNIAGGYTTYRGLKNLMGSNSLSEASINALLGIAGVATLGSGMQRQKKLRNNNLTLDQLRGNYNQEKEASVQETLDATCKMKDRDI